MSVRSHAARLVRFRPTSLASRTLARHSHAKSRRFSADRPRLPFALLTPVMRTRPLILPLCLFWCLTAAACGGDTQAREPAQAEPPATLTLHFEDGSIPLQENREVINMEPVVSMDADGGFIVADMLEAQVRLYSRTGHLRDHFGRKGKGPGEFDGLSAALRLPSKDIVAIDMDGKMGIFSADGELKSTQKIPLVPVYAAVLLDPEHLVIAGRTEGKSDTDLIHVWSLVEERIVGSFFRVPPHSENMATAYSFSGFADVAVRGDTLAAVFALSDSVYLFLKDGTRLGSLRIPATKFRPLRSPMPAPPTPVQEQQWMESFSTFVDIFWTANGGLVAQYFDLEKLEPQWKAVGIDRAGRKTFEYEGSKLVAVSPQDSLFFIHPRAEVPNQWVVATLSR
jgi:hypothetical protein